MRRIDSLEKTLMLGGIEGSRRRGRQRMRWLDGITDSMDVSLSETLGVGDRQGGLACCDSWGRKESDTTEWLNWTELNRVPDFKQITVWSRWLGSPYRELTSCLPLWAYVTTIYADTDSAEAKYHPPTPKPLSSAKNMWWEAFISWKIPLTCI